MITNSHITIYHRNGLDETTHLEKWQRYNYIGWCFNTEGANINKGYDNANTIQIRIPYNHSLNINNFSKGDIIVKGNLTLDIETQKDLKNYEIYNITSINDNNFGNSPHIHLRGQ